MSLDEIRVEGGDPGGRLRLQVQLSTMFLDPEAGRDARPASPLPQGGKA